MTNRPTPGDLPDAVTAAVGRKVRRLRSERGWSLDELVTRSKVSKGVLVSLEQGRSNPNLATLVRLTDAFRLPLTYLVQDDEPTLNLIGPDRYVELWHGPNGGTGKLLVGTQPPNALEIWRWELFPGDRRESEAHAVGTTEVIVVESGRLTVNVDGESIIVPSGSCVTFVADREHGYENATKAKVVFTLVSTVPTSHE